jgi:2-polyprenyl-3-methyl-5-hydroxy-6-metoxy-1,4-benzoquinol methylase
MEKFDVLNTNNQPLPEIWDLVSESYSLEIRKDEEELADEIFNIFQLLKIKTDANLVEVGSGSGHLSGLLARRGFNVTLLDFSPKAIEKSKEFFKTHSFEGQFINRDLYELEYTDSNYDVVWNSGVMEHFNDVELLNAFKSIRKITKNYFVFLVPNPKSIPYLLFRYKLVKDGSWSYGKEYLRENYEEILNMAGFKIIDKKYLGLQYSKAHMEIIFEKNKGVKEFEELVNCGLIPEESAYLIAYIAIPENAEIDIPVGVTKITEKNTNLFDYTAKINGLIESLEVKKKEQKEQNSIIEAKGEEISLLNEKLDNREKAIRVLKENENSLKEKNVLLEKNLADYKQKLARTEQQLIEIEQKLVQTQEYLSTLLSSKSWRIGEKIYISLYNIRLIRYSYKALKIINNYGIRELFKKVKARIKRKRNENLTKYGELNFVKEVKRTIKKYNKSLIIVFPPLLDWNIPLFQRPQHIATQLSNLNYLYFYNTPNFYDNVHGLAKINQNSSLFLTNQYKLLMDILPKRKKVFHIYAQDPNIASEDIDFILNNDDIVLYEYIDALSGDLCADKAKVIERHFKVLNDERCIVICTAQKLYDEVAKYRKNNFALITNGVEFEHFTVRQRENEIPKEIRSILGKGRPIIGYFGALAKWFDYELVEKIAKEKPDYEILLIGWDFDGSLKNSNFNSYDNIHVIGPINYKELPKYAYWFNVSTIPFLINDITESTSPVKLFEYMAMGHPIVTTDMPECRKYKSVLVAKNHDQFIKNLDKAIALKKQDTYFELLKKEALENTWESKALQISGLIKNAINK